MNGAPIENADDLTADWLTANLGGSRVIDFSITGACLDFPAGDTCSASYVGKVNVTWY